MTTIKILDKDALEELQSKLVSTLGREISLPETVDFCAQFAMGNFDDFIAFASSVSPAGSTKTVKVTSRLERQKRTLFDDDTLFPDEDNGNLFKE
ncbi:MAG TPA: hypothetical protein VKK79_01720 [Candidatus Lokiarchaeia archaeon]|nr:hypothetical protein [Candidatus Lokiarchaeia archaeon]